MLPSHLERLLRVLCQGLDHLLLCRKARLLLILEEHVFVFKAEGVEFIMLHALMTSGKPPLFHRIQNLIAFEV
jgi:hypothetical protein